MRYADYNRKMAKLAKFMRAVKRFRVLIIICTTLILGTVATLLSTRGLVYDNTPCPAEIVYGMPLSYKASAFMGSVTYEYREDGSTVWTNEAPSAAGSYSVRAVGKRINGAPCYGDEHKFVISPKPVNITVASELIYGDAPAVVAELADGDSLTCTDFEYKDISLGVTDITPVIRSVTVINAAGTDVTSSYKFNAVTSKVELKQRDIALTVYSAEREYDGTPLYSEEWELVSGTLANGDTIYPSFDASITLPGEVTNTPDIKIIHSDERGETDVTANYNVELDIGMLTVVKRKITIATGNSSREYDGNPLECSEYDIADGTSLVDGDGVFVTEYASITEIGKIDNAMSFEIIDGYGYNVSEYYEITVDSGTLEISPRKITVATSDGYKIYDGSPLYNDDCAVTVGSLLDGHAVNVTARVEAIDVGVFDNLLQITVTNGDDDVSAYYDISYEYGTLEVAKRLLSITAGNAQKVYDGTPLVNTDASNFTVAVTDVDSGLVSGHTVSVAFGGSRTDAGRSQINELTYVKITADGTDVSGNYDIKTTAGFLEIAPRPITVETVSKTFIYNGEKQFETSYDITSMLGLIAGHSLAALQGYTTVTDVCENVVNRVEYSVVGTDTNNYAITVECVGLLSVTKRELNVTAGDCEKIYDGTPLVNTDGSNFTVSQGVSSGLVAGHVITAAFDGALTYVGKEQINVLKSVSVTVDGADVTNNYDIRKTAGYLTITKRDVFVTTGAKTFVYDGADHYFEEFDVRDADETSGLVLAHAIKAVSRTTVHGFTETPVDNILGFNVVDGATDVTHNYNVTVTFGTLTVSKRSAIFTAASVSKMYDGSPLSSTSSTMPAPTTDDYEFLGAADSGLVNGHTYTWSYAENTIVRVSTVLNVIDVITIYDADGYDVTRNYGIINLTGTLAITKRPVKLITPSNDIAHVYDGAPYSNACVNVDGPIGFADTDTVRITDYAKITKVGTADNIVKFVIEHEKEGDVTDCYDIEITYGTLEVVKRPITIKPIDYTAIYNGKFIEWYRGVEYTEFDGENYVGLIVGHEIVNINVTLSEDSSLPPTDAGSYKHKINKVDITDANGVYVTDNYDITYDFGTLTVERRAVTVTSASYEWVYDGETHSYHVIDIDNLVDSHYLAADGNVFDAGKITDVGKVKNVFDKDNIKITYNGKDVTSNYDITCVFGDLTVTPRPITVTAGGSTKVYDGTPLVNKDINNFTYTLFDAEKSEGLVNGQSISVAMDSDAITDVGTALNKIESVTITAGDKDVTDNYEITKVNGELTVTVRKVMIVTATHSWVYDGESHYDTDWDYSSNEEYPYTLLDGHGLDALKWITVSEFDETYPRLKNDVSYTIVDTNDPDHDVSGNYELAVKTGVLKITKRMIIIKQDDVAYIYDGQPHYNDEWSYAKEGEVPDLSHVVGYELTYGLEIVGWHKIIITPVETVTNVSDGAKTNSVKIDLVDTLANDRDVSGNYMILWFAGSIEIVPRPIVIETASADWVYDGEDHSCPEYKITGEYDFVSDHGLKINSSTVVNSVMRDENGNVIGALNKINNFALTGAGVKLSNYDIQISYGTLTVLPLSVIVSSGSIGFDYDKTIHSYGSFDISVADGFKLSADRIDLLKNNIVVIECTQVVDVIRDENGNVTGTPNILTYSISDEISNNFDFTYEWGTLTVFPQSVTLTSKSNSDDPWEYDGTAHRLFEIEDVSLEDGLRVIVVGGSTYTDVGEYENKLEVKIVEAIGNDVSHNYDIVWVYGKVKVTPREITVRAVNADKIYDGTPLDEHGFEIVGENKLIDGHMGSCDYEIEFTDVLRDVNGEVIHGYNSIKADSIRVVDGIGRNVTVNYTFIVDGVNGEWWIDPRPVELISDSDEWVYDGQEHSAPRCSAGDISSLVDGHVAVVLKSTVIKYVGTADNVLMEVAILVGGKGGEDKTANYVISYPRCGTLTVYGDDDTANATGIPVLNITASKSGKVYLRTDSFGDYTGSIDWNSAVDYGTDAGNANYLGAAVLNSIGITENKITVELNPGHNEYYLFGLPYYLSSAGYGDNELDQNSDIQYVEGDDFYVGRDTYTYEAYYYDYDYLADAGVKINGVAQPVLSDFEKSYRDYVYSESSRYLYVGNSTLVVLKQIIADNADKFTLDPDKRNFAAVVKNVAEYIRGIATYNLEYDRSLDSLDDVATAFLSGEYEGVCSHYSTAATVLFRAIGIPARYTVGIVADAVENETITVPTDNLHAWVEVYVDGFGWVNIEVTGGGPGYGGSGGGSGEGDGENGKILGDDSDDGSGGTVDPSTVLEIDFDPIEKNYDGTALVHDGKWSCGNALLRELVDKGYKLTFTFTGERTEPGESKVKLISVKLLDENGNNVTNKYNYKASNGNITVYGNIKLTTVGGSWEYDGLPHSNASAPEYTVDKLTSGWVIVISDCISVTDVCSIDDERTVKVRGADGADNTRYYKISYDYGKLEIYPRTVEISTASGEWEYDGAAHTLDEYEITSGALVNGHYLEIAEHASITHVATCDNDIRFTICDPNGEDKTDNYNIVLNAGTLAVTPRPLTVVTNSGSWVFDACEHFDYDYTVTSGSFADGEGFDIDSYPVIVNAGSVTNKFEISMINPEDYNITWIYGTLTVTPRPITVIAGSEQKIYDGTPLVNTDKDNYIVLDTSENSGLVYGHGIYDVVFASDSVTEPGSVDNVITSLAIRDLDGNDFTSDYSVELRKGVLTVVPRPIKVRASSAEKKYDGTPLTADGFVCVDVDLINFFDLAAGHTGDAECYGSQTDVGSSPNVLDRIDIVIRDANGKIVTHCYDISFDEKDGTLTVDGHVLVITTGSSEFDYDGNIHYDDGYTIEGLTDGDSIDQLGIIAGAALGVTHVLRDGDGNVFGYENVREFALGGSLAGKYIVKVVYGTITVKPVLLHIETDSGAWRYDGEAHSQPSFTVTGELPSGHNAVMVNYPSITEIGETENAISFAVVRGTDPGEDVTVDFDFDFDFGILMILPNDDSETNDAYMWLNSTNSGTLYLRQSSYNTYSGSSTDWYNSANIEYGRFVSYDGNDYGVDYLASILLSSSNASIANVDVRMIAESLYAVPYYKTLDGKHIQTSDVVYTSPRGEIDHVDDMYEFSAQYYTYNYRSDGGALIKSVALDGEYAEIERAYREYVYASDNGYLQVDDKTREFLNGIIEAQGFDAADPDIVNKVAAYIQKSAIYKMNYDPMVDVDRDGVVIAFLSKYKEGLCRHYSTAATMLYRALGIPARYVTGFMANITAGEWTAVNLGHAWVEVYIDGLGWISVEVTGFKEGGNGDGEGGEEDDKKEIIEIKPIDVIEEYNGEPVYAKNEIEDADVKYDTVSVTSLIAKGYRYECTVSGSRVDVGESSSTITSFKLFDVYDKDVTDEYDIRYRDGSIEVVQSLIKVTFGDRDKIYDGTPLKFTELIPGYAYFVIQSPDSVTSVDIDYAAFEGLTNVGKLDGKALVQIFTERGLISVNGSNDISNYTVVFENTSLTVKGIPLTVVITDYYKVYDGKPAEFGEPTVVGNLQSGHTIVLVYRKFVDITDGPVANVPLSCTIVDEMGNDVSYMYDGTVIAGTVEIAEG